MPSIFITGANRGLGLEFARQYKADGWDVVATCRRPAEAPALNALGVEVHALEVGDLDAIAALAAGPLAGRPFDVVLNNAGVYGSEQAFGTLNAKIWQDTFLTNAIAPLKIVEAFLPNILAGEQRKFAFLSTVMASITWNKQGGEYAYRSSKAALNAAGKSLAVDLAGKASIVLLHPGWVKTEMGGPNAQIDPETSITGLRQVIAGLTPETSGSFLDYRGKTVPW